jgi:hypothetical protein
MTKDISHLLRRKAKSHAKWKETKTPHSHRIFQNLCKTVKHEIRKAQANHLAEVIDKIEKNPKPFWQFIKGKRTDSGSIPTLKTPDSTADTDRDKAQALSNQFASVFTKEDLGYIPFDSTSTVPPIPDLTLNSNGILKLLRNLNTSKATGPDLLPARILKDTASEIAPILAFIFSKSYSSGN